MKKLIDFSGRTSRKELIYSMILISLTLLPAFLWLFYIITSRDNLDVTDLIIGLVPHTLLSILLIVPVLALFVRRLHDMGLSGSELFNRKTFFLTKSDEINQYGEVPVSGKVNPFFKILFFCSTIIIILLLLFLITFTQLFQRFIINENLKMISITLSSYNEQEKIPYPTSYGPINKSLKDYIFNITDPENYLYLGLISNDSYDDNLPLVIYRPRVNSFYNRLLKKPLYAYVVDKNCYIIAHKLPYNSNNLNVIKQDIINILEEPISKENEAKFYQRLNELEKKYPSKRIQQKR